MPNDELTDQEWNAIHVLGALGSPLNAMPDPSFPNDDPWDEDA